MAICNHEFWVWTELLAFDNSQKDFGVAEWLERVGQAPDGIALMLSHQDIVIFHPGMDTEYTLSPEYCSRNAHERNAFRHRQDWTNYQLRDLIAELHRHGILVFVSLFFQSHNNQFHKEWVLQFPHPLPCDIDDDGRDFADVFAEKLQPMTVDYGFDGFHGADGLMSGGWEMVGDSPYIRQKMFEKFIGSICGMQAVPEQFRVIDDMDLDARHARSKWIWETYPRQWQKFMTRRWTEFEMRAAEALHAVGKKIMLNSCEAKSIFEAGFYFGFDTRGFAEAKVDYILVESVATSCNLIYGTEDYPQRAHQIYSCVQELTAALPDLKVITMTGVCDPVESFNSIRHAPNMLERDIYFCANQCVITEEGEKRCADGMLVCLGDSLKKQEWRSLVEYVRQAADFPIAKSEGYAWLYSDAVQDAMPDSFMKHGTIAPYLQTTELTFRGVMLPAICRSEFLHLLKGRPLFVPDFDLLSAEEWEKIKQRSGLTVLTGNLQGAELPQNAQVAIQTPVTDDYTLGLVVLNSPVTIELKNIDGIPQNFDLLRRFSTVRDPAPKMDVSPSFWDECAKLMKSLLPHPLQGEGFTLIHQDVDGRRRIAIASRKNQYFVPNFTMDSQNGHQLVLLSDYVCTDLTVKDGKLSGKGAERIYSQIFIPPQGLFLMEDVP